MALACAGCAVTRSGGGTARSTAPSATARGAAPPRPAHCTDVALQRTAQVYRRYHNSARCGMQHSFSAVGKRNASSTWNTWRYCASSFLCAWRWSRLRGFRHVCCAPFRRALQCTLGCALMTCQRHGGGGNRRCVEVTMVRRVKYRRTLRTVPKGKPSYPCVPLVPLVRRLPDSVHRCPFG